MPRVVLGVCGSISAYRAADLARDLMRAGCEVRVCLTDSAQKFVTPILFETLTGQPCLIDTFDEPKRGRMAHLDWARQADLLLIAPATANTINRIANGYGDDMLTTLALAYEGPVVVAPAMNPAMLSQEVTQESLSKLASRAVTIIEPQEGDVVAGEQGQGKLATNQRILEVALGVLSFTKLLAGKRVLITSGPTQEALDDVRFLSNRSSGKMGAALAQAALLMGAEVTVVAGPSTAAYPRLAWMISVRSAQEMLDKAKAEAVNTDLIIGAAAVADYRPEQRIAGKMRRSGEALDLRLTANPDIIAELARIGKRTIGFAAEPSMDLIAAKEKLTRKGLFAIAHNDVSNAQIGFETDQNQLTLIKQGAEPETSPVQSKLLCAKWLLERVI